MSKLKIFFESDQEHQIRAIESAVKLFKGYTRRNSAFQMGDETIPNMDNYEMLDEKWLVR
jgi:type III restriction enzyme